MQIRRDVDTDTMTCKGALLFCLWRIAANEYHQNNTKVTNITNILQTKMCYFKS